MTPTIEERDLLHKGKTSQPLEFYVRVPSPHEHHFYARGVSFADFSDLFSKTIFDGEALIYRMPHGLLNPNYWEPLTRENEQAVHEKMGGRIIREDKERPLLWRSDQIARGRLLRDAVDVPVELIEGRVFRTSGPGLLEIAEAWTDGAGRLEFALFGKLPTLIGHEMLTVVHHDIDQLRMSLPEEKLLFTSKNNETIRVVFPGHDSLRRAVSALVRGWVFGLTQHHMAYLTDRVTDAVIRVTDGLGFTAHPERDFVNKLRTYEIHGKVGRTEWPAVLSPDHELAGDEKVLIYYDLTSGIWAVAT